MHADNIVNLPIDANNITTKGLRVPYPDVNHSTATNLPPDPDNMNDLRAQGADDALVTFAGKQEIDHQTLADLICDAAHWSDRNRSQMAKVWKMAAKRYNKETKGQGRQFSA